MVFAEHEIECRPVADYQRLQLVEFWIDDQEKAVNFLSRFLSGQEKVSNIPILNTFMHSRAERNSSGHSASGWPSWVYTVSADSRNGEQRVFLDQQPTVNMGLPPFKSPADAVRSWVFHESRCDGMTNDVPNQEAFLVVIPDIRARFVSGRWSPGRLELAIETTIWSDLELQIIQVGSEQRSANFPVTAEPMVLDIPEDARELVLVIVHKAGDLLCLHSLNGLYRSFGKFQDEETHAIDFGKELQQGENEVREFKSFVTPQDKKEFELVKTVVAFANTDGGTIFMGVNDEGVPLGIAAASQCFKKRLDPIEAQKLRLKSLVTENTKPVPSVTYSTASVSGNVVVIAQVKKSPSVCSTQDNRVYVRRGATSRLADPETELRSLLGVPSIDLSNPWE
jgi:hypothetical protein